MVKKAGSRGKPVVITSGAHSSEPAGVFASLLLMKEIELPNPVYWVPLRDPFGWQGYELCLEYALNRKVRISNYEDLKHTLTHCGGEVLHEEPGFIVVIIKDLVFISIRPPEKPTGPREVEQRVNKLLADRPKLLQRMGGRRLIFPANSGDAEGVGNIYRAFTVVINKAGFVADMNRGFGGEDEPAEVRCLRKVVDEIQPGLVLDLHEGQGRSFYFFVPAYTELSAARRLTDIAVQSICQTGTRLFTLDELVQTLGPGVRKGFEEPVPGVFSGRVENKTLTGGSSFGAYCQRFGPSLTFESGRWAPLKQRVSLHLTAAKAVLEAYKS